MVLQTRWAGMSTVVLVVVAALYYFIVYAVKRNIMFFPRRVNEAICLDDNLIDGVAYETVRCLGDVEVMVYYRREPDRTKPFVLYSHGAMEIIEYNMDHFQDSFEHVNLIAYNYRGYGRSEDASPSDWNTAIDVLYILAWIKQKFPYLDIREDVTMYGRSIGTHVFGRLVGDPARQNILPRRLFLFTPFARYSDVIGHNSFSALAKFLRPMLKHVIGDMELINDLRTYLDYNDDRRLYILGIENDELTPFEHCRELHDGLNSPKCTFDSIKGFHTMRFTEFPRLAAFATTDSATAVTIEAETEARATATETVNTNTNTNTKN